MKNVLLIYGGKSSEHDISVMSAKYIFQNIDPQRFRVWTVGITKEGGWFLTDGICEEIASGTACMLSPDATKKALYTAPFREEEKIGIDVIFPCLHGLYGEDGTIQGLFEMAETPYVGCGVLSSAVSMDKLYTKMIVNSFGIRQAVTVAMTRAEIEEQPEERIFDLVETKLSYPVFVKPSCAGSSVGVTKVKNREMLTAALKAAAKEDRNVMVEECIFGREIECAVFGTKDRARAYGVGEVISAKEFYDFEAKYENNDSVTTTDPDIPSEIKKEIMAKAEIIFKAVGGSGLSRVDFFYTKDGEVVFNELNTMPGFTSISMYPKMMESAGISGKELITELIDVAMDRKEH